MLASVVATIFSGWDYIKNGKDLLKVSGKQSPVSEERTPEYYKTRPCVRFVITACEILDKHFFE